MVLLCGVDKYGRVRPLGVKYDQGTGLASLAISRGAGKNTFAYEFLASTTDFPVVNPGLLQKVCVASVYCAGDGDAGAVELDFVAPNKAVFRHYMTKYNNSFASDMHIEGELNQNLLLTTTTGNTSLFLVVNYRLVD